MEHTPLDKTSMDKGMRLAFIGQSAGILLVMLMLRSAFGPLFLKHLGASDTLTMWVFALPGLAPVVQIPLSLTVPPHRIKQFLIGGWTFWGLLMTATALIPSAIGASGAALAVTTATLVLALLVNLGAGTFWFPLLTDVIPADRRGRFFGKLRATWTILLYLSIVLSGIYLGETPTTGRFQAVILVGVGLVFVRNLFIAKVPTPKISRSRADEYRDWRRYLRDIYRNTPLRLFLIYYTLLGAAAGFLSHPLVIYMNDVGINPRDNILIFGSTTLGMVATLFFGGRIIDRFGVKGVFSAVHWTLIATLAAAVGVTFMSPSSIPTGLTVIFVVSGAAVALSNLACTTHLFSFVPTKGRAFFLTFSNLMLAIGPSIALFVTGAVLKGVGDAGGFTVAGATINAFQMMLLVAATLALSTTPLLCAVTRRRDS